MSSDPISSRRARASVCGFNGILSVCPYYNRPSEDGIREHFRRVAESTDRPILIYNIPYRTGANLSNDSVLELSEVKNIVGVKDCCASLPQTIDLLRRKPPDFAVMTGEDALFYTALALGGNGGILSSAHFASCARTPCRSTSASIRTTSTGYARS